MPLPIQALPTDTVIVNGESIAIRSLSRAEAVHILTLGRDENRDEAAVEAYTIARGTDSTEAEATAYLDSVDAATGQVLINAIMELSGLAVRAIQATADAGENPEAPKA